MINGVFTSSHTFYDIIAKTFKIKSNFLYFIRKNLRLRKVTENIIFRMKLYLAIGRDLNKVQKGVKFAWRIIVSNYFSTSSTNLKKRTL